MESGKNGHTSYLSPLIYHLAPMQNHRLFFESLDLLDVYSLWSGCYPHELAAYV